MHVDPPAGAGIQQEPLVCFAIAAGCFAISVPACLYNLQSTEPTNLAGFAAVGAFYALLGAWRRRGGDPQDGADPRVEPSCGDACEADACEDDPAPDADGPRARAAPRAAADSGRRFP